MIDPITLLAGGSIGGLVSTHFKGISSWLTRHMTYEMTCYSYFHNAMAWRLLKDSKDSRLIFGTPGSTDSLYTPSDDSESMQTDKIIGRMGYGRRMVKVEGRRVWVNVGKEKIEQGYIESTTVTVAKKHEKWLLGYLRETLDLFRAHKSSGLEIYAMNGQWWEHSTTRPFRPIDTILHEAPKQILERLREWKEEEEAVVAKGENYHIGFLLSGVPCSGKTSTVIAIASELRKPVYVVTPSEGAARIQDLIRKVPKGGILLIEECETLLLDRDSEDTTSDKAVSSLLSTLDGPLSPHGVIRFYTTNHPERLDPSFLRAGRVDHHYHFDKPYVKEENRGS